MGSIRERLEDYLRQSPGKKLPLQFEEHLRSCEACREELSWMQEQSQMLHVLAPARRWSRRPASMRACSERIETAADPVDVGLAAGTRFRAPYRSDFARRWPAFWAGIWPSRSRVSPPRPDAEAIIAVEDHPPNLGVDRQRDRDTMLVTLATYNE